MRLGGWHGHGVARPSEGDFSSDRGRNPIIKIDPLPEFGQNLLPNWCGDTAYLKASFKVNGDSALCLSYPFGDSPPRYRPESRDCRSPGPQAACGTDQNALLITPPSTRTAAPVVAEANGLAR